MLGFEKSDELKRMNVTALKYLEKREENRERRQKKIRSDSLQWISYGKIKRQRLSETENGILCENKSRIGCILWNGTSRAFILNIISSTSTFKEMWSTLAVWDLQRGEYEADKMSLKIESKCVQQTK